MMVSADTTLLLAVHSDSAGAEMRELLLGPIPCQRQPANNGSFLLYEPIIPAETVLIEIRRAW
jgi:hypothetical protein